MGLGIGLNLHAGADNAAPGAFWVVAWSLGRPWALNMELSAPWRDENAAENAAG